MTTITSVSDGPATTMPTSTAVRKVKAMTPAQKRKLALALLAKRGRK